MSGEQMYLFGLNACEDEEFFGVDGDGLCEGEELSEGELQEEEECFFLTLLEHE